MSLLGSEMDLGNSRPSNLPVQQLVTLESSSSSAPYSRRRCPRRDSSRAAQAQTRTQRAWLERAHVGIEPFRAYHPPTQASTGQGRAHTGSDSCRKMSWGQGQAVRVYSPGPPPTAIQQPGTASPQERQAERLPAHSSRKTAAASEQVQLR